VLAQHLVTVGAGGGFVADELYREVRTTYAYRDLTPEEWQWALDFVIRGGPTLRAYPQYARLTRTPSIKATSGTSLEIHC
jgi:ATP-dependent Lhr-like helicase